MTIKNASELDFDERSAFRLAYINYFEASASALSDYSFEYKDMLKRWLFSRSEGYAKKMLRRIEYGQRDAVIGFDKTNRVIGFVVGSIDSVGGEISHLYSTGESFLRKRSNELKLLRAFSDLVSRKGGILLTASTSLRDEELSETLVALGFEVNYTLGDTAYYSRTTDEQKRI